MLELAIKSRIHLPMNMLDDRMLFKFDEKLNFTYIVAANDNECYTYANERTSNNLDQIDC